MTNGFRTVLALVLVIPGPIFTASCTKKEVRSEPAVIPATSAKEKAEGRRLAEEKARQEALAEQVFAFQKEE